MPLRGDRDVDAGSTPQDFRRYHYPVTPVRRDWIAVASADHVALGVAGGFMQVGHGKAAPLRRLHAGDRMTYYAPYDRLHGGRPVQAFVAFGMVLDEAIEPVETGQGFRPFRRNVAYLQVHPAPIRPLLEQPGFALSGRNWGARLRFGLLEIDSASMDRIAAALGVPDHSTRAETCQN